MQVHDDLGPCGNSLSPLDPHLHTKKPRVSSDDVPTRNSALPVGELLSDGVSYKCNLPITEQEAQVFQFLKEVVEHFKLGSTLRVAGGWVRDKVTPLPPLQAQI